MLKIFILDDDPSLQRLHGLILGEAGFEILDTALNGKEAIEKYNKFEVKPELNLMDYNMPIKNGLDAMTEILKINNHENIILASADITIKQKAISLRSMCFYR